MALVRVTALRRLSCPVPRVHLRTGETPQVQLPFRSVLSRRALHVIVRRERSGEVLGEWRSGRHAVIEMLKREIERDESAVDLACCRHVAAEDRLTGPIAGTGNGFVVCE